MALGIEPSKTQRIYLGLRDRIARGELPPGGPLPGEHMLALEYGVSRITVRRALAELAREGLVDRRQGAGTFVAGNVRPEPIAADVVDMLAGIKAMGLETSVRLLQFGYRRAPRHVAEALGLDEGDRVQHSIRVRLIDGKPFSHLTTCVPESVGRSYTEEDLASRPLLSLLERSGIAVERATQELSAALATPDVADHLDVAVGSPLIALTRTVFDAEDRGVEHLTALYRPDRYAVRMNLVRMKGWRGRRWAMEGNGR
ncbi:MAG: GntR family transcriptional regulator [Alphaproteobacteria bacterium]|nr:GntR family transcriptional regulator [Alphaproteobacteria bacterium]